MNSYSLGIFFVLMKENRDFKGVWISKEIWLNTDLSIIEKVLLVEIDSLDNSDKGCFASNEYLAKFVQLSQGRVANIISDLKKRKFLIQVFFDGRNRGLRISKRESSFNENVKADLTKTGKQPTRKREHNNTSNNTDNNTIISSKNSIEFCQNEEIEIIDSPKQKLNPFQVVSDVEKERKENFAPKEKKEKAERQPSPTYAAFSVFCQTFESLSGAAYPTDQNGHYIMMPKDAGQMANLMRYIDKIDRQGDSIEALKVFIQAAWNLNDKWLKANFTIANLYSQASKIFTAYQTSSPAAKDKAYNERIQELLAERMAKFQD